METVVRRGRVHDLQWAMTTMNDDVETKAVKTGDFAHVEPEHTAGESEVMTCL